MIDFHTHVFPDKIAKKTVAFLAEKGGYPPHTDGTVDGLLAQMEEGGIDISVTLPVLTSPHQFEGVNRFATQINEAFADKERRLLSFGGIHPACEDIEGKMTYLHEAGFLGIKIHPDYQETFIDDDRYLRIIACAKKLDMIVVTHAGPDPAYPDQPVRCTPKRLKEVIRAVPYSKLVLAHLGGPQVIEEVMEELCGEDIYFDTAFVLTRTSRETFRKMLRLHGEDRILFATDSPWSNAKQDVARLRSFSLGTTVEEKILSRNAEKLLGLA